MNALDRGASEGAPYLILDIGTHKVLGLAAIPHEDGVQVLASSLARHAERSMRDGQVHDVKAVARVVKQVVRELEKAAAHAFDGAHVAAAGRALRTARGRAEASHPQSVTVTAEMERVLVWEAVADAQANLLETLPAGEQVLGYYAVAHSLTASWLDGDEIGSLVGHRGRLFGVEALATFLPGVVVDSLEAVLREAGLEMCGLTLEPIAALEAVIPSTSRHLRLALIDIGAGTSDIALTGGGRVEAYAMVPQAGDAITEAVSKALLLDFAVAERVKRAVSQGESVSAENVLGEPVHVDLPLLEELIAGAADRLAEAIASELARWAGGGLDAVLLVGGGSKTPGLAERLARCLDVPVERVALRDRRAVRGVLGAEHLSGPDAITALGIALRACRGQEMPPVRVRVNGRPVCLFLPDRCTVREAARVAGLSPADLMGRLGPGITITINGEVVAIPGTRGEPAVARLRGEQVTLDTMLQNMDEVVLEPPKPGLPARPTVEEAVSGWLERKGGRLDGEWPRIRLLGTWREVPLWVSRNGRKAAPGDVVMDRDVLEVRWPRTARELLEALQERGGEAAAAGLGGVCLVNGKPVSLSRFVRLYRNGAAAELSDPVHDGDTWDWESVGPPAVGELMEALGIPRESALEVTLNGCPVTIRRPARILLNGAPAQLTDRVGDGDVLDVLEEESVSLYEILPYAGISWEEGRSEGRRLVLKVRGRPAEFTTLVRAGDDVAVGFV